MTNLKSNDNRTDIEKMAGIPARATANQGIRGKKDAVITKILASRGVHEMEAHKLTAGIMNGDETYFYDQKPLVTFKAPLVEATTGENKFIITQTFEWIELKDE